MKNIILRDYAQRKGKHTLIENPLDVLQRIKEKNLDDLSEECLREIRKKHSSYKSQDKHKHKFDESQHITMEDMIDKMIKCEMKCYYCNHALLLSYNKKKDGMQWTLERLNNNLGHYEANTCIACLKCNLGRRTDNHEYYKKGKTMILEKVI